LLFLDAALKGLARNDSHVKARGLSLSEAFSYEILAAPQKARGPRVGRLTTPHGPVDTPAFIPVGTKATVKGVLPDTLRQIGAQLILANTYHLALRPGSDVVRDLGGLHAMMAWDGPILTDSGGFQVFSLANLRKVTDEGVTFRNHIDGAEMTLTPESAMAIENDLGADIIMALDVCPPFPAPREEVEEAVRRTLAWAERCRAAHRRTDQALWCIVQGGVHADLREACAAKLVAMDFPGYAIGGVSVGEGHEHLRHVVDCTAPLLPWGRPRYLMGVGELRDVVVSIAAGVDLFDCVLPTRNGRNGCVFTADGMIRLRNEAFKTDRQPIEEDCDCPTCQHFSRGTLRHLCMSQELLAPILLSIHNLRFFTRFFGRLRTAIAEGRFDTVAQGLLDRYYAND
jgi:queuine tRNA-ribosyltransferase